MDIKILIRFDDICPTMDFVQFRRATDLLDKYNIKPLIGVIPNCADPDLQINNERGDFWDFLSSLQDKGYTIAMHGYEHIFCSPFRGIVTNRIGSEFAGLPLQQQKDKIKQGKSILQQHGFETDIFFAPAHSYDRNTIKALSACGFKYMSDGKSRRAYVLDGIKMLPCRSAGAANIKGGGYYTSVFHAHEWVRPDKAYDYGNLERTLAKYSQYIVSFSEYCRQPVGHTTLQRIDEWSFVIWQNSIRPQLSNVYQRLKSFVRR